MGSLHGTNKLMMTEEFRGGIAEALQLPPTEVTETTRLGENWDSVAMLSAISLIDHCYGITVSAAELEKCQTVGDLLRLTQQPS